MVARPPGWCHRSASWHQCMWIVEEAWSSLADTPSGRADVGGSGGGAGVGVISGRRLRRWLPGGSVGARAGSAAGAYVVDAGYSLVSTRSVFDHRRWWSARLAMSCWLGWLGWLLSRPRLGWPAVLASLRALFLFAGQGLAVAGYG